jgi:coenzyme F420-reducing hydrogenase gamma subunit
MHKPSLTVWKFASCGGCLPSVLDCEDELKAIAGTIDFVRFPEARCEVKPGSYDVSLVDGSIHTHLDRERIQAVRAQSNVLVSIGACATHDGIQALRKFAHVDEFINAVYASPSYIETLKNSTAISDHVKVDYELHGCPIDKFQLMGVLIALLHGQMPDIPSENVCSDCNRAGLKCVMVSRRQACLGPVTHTGCRALCPKLNRPCFGCIGPQIEDSISVAVKIRQHLPHDKPCSVAD